MFDLIDGLILNIEILIVDLLALLLGVNFLCVLGHFLGLLLPPPPYLELLEHLRVAQAPLLVAPPGLTAPIPDIAVLSEVVRCHSVPLHPPVLVRVEALVVVGPGLLRLEGLLAVVAPDPLFDQALLHLQAPIFKFNYQRNNIGVARSELRLRSLACIQSHVMRW